MKTVKKLVTIMLAAMLVVGSVSLPANAPTVVNAEAAEITKSYCNKEIKRLDKKIGSLKKQVKSLNKKYKTAKKKDKKKFKGLSVILTGDILCRNPFIVQDRNNYSVYCFKSTKNVSYFFNTVLVTYVKPTRGITRFGDYQAQNVKAVKAPKTTATSVKKKLDSTKEKLDTAREKKSLYKKTLKTKVKADQKVITMNVGDSFYCGSSDYFTITNDTKYTDYSTSISDTSVADIEYPDEGGAYITAKAPGTTKYTLKMVPSGSKATVTIKVVDNGSTDTGNDHYSYTDDDYSYTDDGSDDYYYGY